MLASSFSDDEEIYIRRALTVQVKVIVGSPNQQRPRDYGEGKRDPECDKMGNLERVGESKICAILNALIYTFLSTWLGLQWST
jgi:hypothetical protein